MSYRQPPGSTSQPNSGRSTPQAHGLPARPPASAAAAPSAAFSFKPRAVATPSTQQHSYPTSGYDLGAPTYPGAAPAQSYHPPQGDQYGGQYGASYSAQGSYGQDAPQMRNPFAPPPSGAGGSASQYGQAYDPEYQAQLQQWQSQYNAVPDPKTTASQGKMATGNANHTPLGQKRAEPTATLAAPESKLAPTNTATEANKTVVRKGGGQSWEDTTLLEWGNHHRLFIGNLAGEVTDESLLKAFAKFPSVQKARVVRDKRTTKSKGFGFVSLSDADEYFQAAKEMQGKYIGSHPVLIRRAEAEIKAVNKKDDRNKHGKYKGKGGDGGRKNDKDVLSSQAGGGVKKGGKAEGKYKVLG